MSKSNMNHRERLEITLIGEKPDRPPVALWRHFPVDDQRPDRLAQAVADFQMTFDFDFIKVTPASSYCVKDWGIEDRWEGNSEGTRRYLAPLVSQTEDWNRIKLLDPNIGCLGGSLETLRLLRKEFSSKTPIIQTIFSPLAQAKNLVGKTNLASVLRREPTAFHSALARITENTLHYLDEAKKTGIDGIFYAVQQAQYGLLSPAEFSEFGRKYDLQILQAAQDLWLNVVHLHGDDVMFDSALDYPVQVINWHDRQTEPNLKRAKEMFAGTVCGGLRQIETMLLGDPDKVLDEAIDAVNQTGGIRFILGTGCVIPITTPYGNIMAARRSVEVYPQDSKPWQIHV